MNYKRRHSSLSDVFITPGGFYQPTKSETNRDTQKSQLNFIKKDTGKRKPICIFFTKGKCKKGNNCDFIHDVTHYKKSVCKYFEKGSCRKGDDCTFLHGNN